MNHKDFAQIPQKNADKEKLLYNPSSGRSTNKSDAILSNQPINKPACHRIAQARQAGATAHTRRR
jgi:hypothetical protein